MYSVTDKEVIKRVLKRLKHSSNPTHDGKAIGYAVGRWYIIYSTYDRWEGDGESYKMSIVATDTAFKKLIAEDEDEDKSPIQQTNDTEIPVPVQKKKSLQIYERTGSYFNPYYRKRKVSLPKSEPRPDQQAIMDKIIAHQDVKEHTVAFIHGPPGTGKSMMGLLLANHYEGTYCNSLKPWEPGNYIGELYAEVSPTKEQPLILAMDEIDCALMVIHSGVPAHKNLPIATGNKSGWNHFLDEIGRGMFPHLILLLTSNKGPDFIRSLDASYIRDGRVNLIAELA